MARDVRLQFDLAQGVSRTHGNTVTHSRKGLHRDPLDALGCSFRGLFTTVLIG
jgi:hypothetical protein